MGVGLYVNWLASLDSVTFSPMRGSFSEAQVVHDDVITGTVYVREGF